MTVESKEIHGKAVKGEVLEYAPTNVMKTVTDGMRSSDKMFTKLEEKRLKFEEQQKRGIWVSAEDDLDVTARYGDKQFLLSIQLITSNSSTSFVLYYGVAGPGSGTNDN